MSAKKFGMFSAVGNKKVAGLVYKAKKAGKSWEQVEADLNALAQMKGFKEAADSVVKEAAYVAMEFSPRQKVLDKSVKVPMLGV